MLPNDSIALFSEALSVDRTIAVLLVTRGLSTVEEVAYVPFDELTSVVGGDRALAQALRDSAKAHLLRKAIGDSYRD